MDFLHSQDWSSLWILLCKERDKMKQNSHLGSDVHLSPGHKKIQTVYLVCDSIPLKTCLQRLHHLYRSYPLITLNTSSVTFEDRIFHGIH